MYVLKVPKFMAIEPMIFDTPSFNIPTTEHHSRTEQSPAFSAFSTAMSTVRWRRSPSDHGELQSNARVLRWSDGSLTLQLASDPTQQYEIAANALAPPQKNALKPTPTSLKAGQKATRGHETYTYLTVPDASVGLLRTTHKFTAGLSVLPSATTTDDALERLQNSLAAAVRGKNVSKDGAIEVLKVEEDPELAKKKAEVAEREKARAQKRREAAENRERDRSNRTLGRAGLSSTRYSAGGLTAGMLEDEEMGTTRARAKPKANRRRAYNDEYSDDEDLGRRKGNFAADEYEVDDFVAGSDEEDEAEEEEESDPDEGLGEATRERSPKRGRPAADDDEEEDAEGEPDDDVQAPRRKQRRVIDDEDEE